MWNVSVTWQRIFACYAVLFCCGQADSAEILGSADPQIRKNFNQLLTSNACKGCNLRGVVLNRLNLAEADLEGADLSGARLDGVCLTGANLHNTVLRGASLAGADLTGANLLGADMEGTDFSSDNGGTARAGKQGQQAADSALDTVNSAIEELFIRREPNNSAEKNAVSASQPEEIPIFFAPTEETVNVQAAARRNIDDIPVIRTESAPKKEKTGDSVSWNFFFDIEEKERAEKSVAIQKQAGLNPSVAPAQTADKAPLLSSPPTPAAQTLPSPPSSAGR
jgi:hypothetical protein